MKRFIPSAISLALLAAAAGGAAAQTPAVGATVRDPQGEVLGRIESVVTDRTGRPVQVMVRSRRTPTRVRTELRALPAASLKPAADGFSTPLRKSEFDILPSIRR